VELADRTAALKAFLDKLPGATAEARAAATGAIPLVLIYKVAGKMFAILSVRKSQNVILKSDAHLAEILRETYTGIGHRSHLDRRFWIAVDLDADVPPNEVERLAAASYALVSDGLTKKQKAELATL
jgi:predicted DNA-binding protein (MmcQ/YjbR family)